MNAAGQPRIVIVGPTGSGKTQAALTLAQQLLHSEICSLDSMCVYREMDIGTAKPTLEDRAAVPHHLIDLVDPDVETSLAWFQQEAHRSLEIIRRRNAVPILVGGTGLYQRAVVDNLDIPPQYPEVVASIAGSTTQALFEQLVHVDPLAASRMEATNRRRIMRALEVALGSGRPFSSFGPGLETYQPTTDILIGLAVDRDRLASRLQGRVEQMVSAGFAAEVTRLSHRIPRLSKTAEVALGYREMFAYVNGDISLGDAIDEIVVRTRKFAVRQIRWFRRDPRITWFDAESASLDDQILSHVTKSSRASLV